MNYHCDAALLALRVAILCCFMAIAAAKEG